MNQNEITKQSESIKIFDVFSEDGIYDDFRLANYKKLQFEVKDIVGQDICSTQSVYLCQDFNLNKGGIFWDGSYLLIKYFIQYYHNQQKSQNIQILELGGGTSLPTIITKLLGYKSFTTDLNYLIPFVKQNIELNLENLECVKVLEWGNLQQINELKQNLSSNQKFDFIFGAELIYIEESFDDLIQTLNQFADQQTVIIFSFRIRMKSKFDSFFDKFEEFFQYQYIDRSILSSIHPNRDLQLIVAKKL